MFFVQIPEINDDKLYAMAAIINSTPFAYFAKSIANPQQGGFYKFNKQFLAPVPFPKEEFILFGERMKRLVSIAKRIEETNSAIATNISSASRYKTDVKVMKELNPFLDRLDSLNAHQEELRKDIVFKKDDRYAEYTDREELLKHIILAVSL